MTPQRLKRIAVILGVMIAVLVAVLIAALALRARRSGAGI